MITRELHLEEFLRFDMDSPLYVHEYDLDVTDSTVRALPILFQNGYLTIKEYDPYCQLFTLGVPNVELMHVLAPLTLSIRTNMNSSWIFKLNYKLIDAEWEKFFEGLRSLYSAMPYGPKEQRVHEFSYERVLLTLLWSQAIHCKVEDRQANGQADIVAVHACGVFIFELKVGESAAAALDQVKEKGYDAPYRAKNLPIWLIGLNFDRETRKLIDAKAEEAI